MVGLGGVGMVTEKVVMVELKKIDRPKISGRDAIDPTKVIELAESIREKGLMNPILLRPNNGRYEIVAGDRRFLAHEHLKEKAIAAFIRAMDEKETIIYRAIENLQRENLNPVEEARAYNTMVENGGMAWADVCKATGKSKSHIQRYLRLWRMPEEFKKAVEGGKVSIGVAEKLIEVEDPFLRGEYLRMASENGITVMVAEMWATDYLKSVAGQKFEGMGEIREGDLNPEPKPVYVTCEVCLNPVEIRAARQVTVCGDCRKKVRHS